MDRHIDERKEMHIVKLTDGLVHRQMDRPLGKTCVCNSRQTHRQISRKDKLTLAKIDRHLD